MLRKHLQRLEQPLEGEKIETNLDSGPEEENIEPDDIGMYISVMVKF